MRTLHLLRHAKSSWDDLGLRDHDRPLSERGERSAAAIGAYLRQIALAPDLVLCSTARRAVDTLKAIRGALPAGTRVEISRGLYEVDSAALLSRIRRIAPGVGVVLVVGHNPGMEDLAAGLSGPDSESGPRKALARKFPTGALASLEIEDEWDALDWDRGRLVRFVTPKELV